MSAPLNKTIRAIRLPSAQKAVALAIADHIYHKAPEKGTWVGVETLMRDTGLSERSVYYAIEQLEKSGILVTIGHKKGRSANLPIRVLRPENGTPLPPREEAKEPANIAPSSAPSQTEEAANGAEEPATGAEEPAKRSKEPAIGAEEPARVAPDRDMTGNLEWEENGNGSGKKPTLKSSNQNLGGQVEALVDYAIRKCKLAEAGDPLVRKEIRRLLSKFTSDEIKGGLGWSHSEWEGLGEFKQGSTKQPFFLKNGLEGWTSASIAERKEREDLERRAAAIPVKPLMIAQPEEEDEGGLDPSCF